MRYKNGYVDDGREVGVKSNCPNCNSTRYFQTVSREWCDSCKYEFDYWGGGGNEVAQRLQERRIHEYHMERLRRDEEIRQEHERNLYDY